MEINKTIRLINYCNEAIKENNEYIKNRGIMHEDGYIVSYDDVLNADLTPEENTIFECGQISAYNNILSLINKNI